MSWEASFQATYSDMMKCKENFTLNEDVQLELKKRFIKYNHFNFTNEKCKVNRFVNYLFCYMFGHFVECH